MIENAKVERDLSTDPAAEPDGRLAYSVVPFKRVTHYLFRYPAKFHPPVARHLIEAYTEPGQLVLDPFCGSGTMMVEASMLGRRSIGTDIDPIAVLASSVKSSRLRPGELERSVGKLLVGLKGYWRTDSEYERRKFEDYTEIGFKRMLARRHVMAPTIPNLFHWFRKYVVVDLALIKRTIEFLRSVPSTHRNVFRLAFAATIRRASNADPVPVSGLEVTSHMLRLNEKGRVVNPFQLIEMELRRACGAFREYWGQTTPGMVARTFRIDARAITKKVRRADAVITSPPYHGAVDYYRRHTLETYWLGFAVSPEDRLALLPQYIGRAKVRQAHEYADTTAISSAYMKEWERRIRQDDPARADAFKHYSLAMQSSIAQLAHILPDRAPAVFVVGNSRWRDKEIDTSRLISELCKASFEVVDRHWYPLKNRYMSYSRHNGASIDREHVLVLRRRSGGT